MSLDWNAVRAEFPALENWTYLNTATYGQLSRRSAARVAEHFAHRNELACWDFLNWFDDMDVVRGLLARLVNCSRDDIAFIQNASTGLALMIAGMEWAPGDRVVTLESEFPNNIYAPSVLGRRGVEFVETSWEKFYDSIDERTRLVAISSANYVTGFVPPLAEIGAFLRKRGVLFYVDGTQSLGALRLDVGSVQPDMLAAHGYKWLNCPDGAAFMYVNPELRKRLAPAAVGWRSHRDWRNVDNLHHGAPQFAEGAEKYEGGMLPFALLYGMQASLELVFEIGPEAIEKRVLQLGDHVRAVARELGGEPVSVNSAIVPVRFEGRDASKLARALKENRVLVAARHGLLRVSTHFYNNESDIERLRAALKELL
jgi:cysteine desulfurase/selenocysteine lyase